MSAHRNSVAVARQANLVHRVDPVQVKAVNQKLVILRRALDESGIKHAAIAAALKVSPQYLSMLLSGEKTWTVKHQDDLPEEIEAIYSRLYAEAYGHVVLTPATTRDDALKSIASGFLGLLSPRLPQRADRMVKASLPGEDDV
jgi:hypothetical protein